MHSLRNFFPYPLIAFLVGVGGASLFLIGNAYFLLLLLLTVSTFIFAIVYRRREFLYATILLAFLYLGMIRFAFWEDAPRDLLLETHIDQSVVINGVVDDEPDIREEKTGLFIAVRSINIEGVPTPALGRVQLFAPRYPTYEYGDVVRVKGKLTIPKKFTEDDGRVFDYPAYLASKGVHYQIPFPIIEGMGKNEGNIVLQKLFVIKHRFLDILGTLFPEPENALLGGLLLGGKQSLGNSWQEIFQKAGIIHIVVLSGYNMTIVSEWLVAIFSFLGFYGSISVGGAGIILFALMTGAGATVLRAAIMALIALLARVTGRTYTMGRALLVAGVCMVLQNPSILAYDPSFQLSFLASLGLIFVSPVIEMHTKIFSRTPVWREVFVSTLATQVVVLPLLLFQTGMLSLVSLPMNMIILPIIPLTMLTGFVAGVVASVLPVLGPIVALPAHALLSWILIAASAGVKIPYAALHLPISSLVVFALYVLLALFLWRAHATLPSPGRGVIPQSPLLSSRDDKKETK